MTISIFASKIDSFVVFIESLKTKNIKHIKGGSLFDHLLRTKDFLSAWGLDENILLAALGHSLYTTEYFKEQILDINSRDTLIKKIGKDAEEIIYFFALLKRETISYSAEKGVYSFESVIDGKEIIVDAKVGYALIHIMLANDLDHLAIHSIGYQLSHYDKYAGVHCQFSDAAKKELYKLRSLDYFDSLSKKNSSTIVRFIAHAGVQIANEKISVVVDPWLYASHREKSIIEGFDPTQRTIDYLIPEPKNIPKDFSPDIICLSHFHTHHSPLQEILDFLKIKPVTIICPTLDSQKLLLLRQKIGDYMYGRITFIFIDSSQEILLPNVTIKTISHQRDMVHLMFFIKVGDKSIFHVVDAKANTKNNELSFDSRWDSVYGLNPDFLFVGAAGHLLKKINNNKRDIIEASSLTPVQAAKLAVMLNAKNVGVIGVYNHSVWDDRLEMGFSVSDTESQFYWALSFLSPSTGIKILRPGDILL